MSNLERMTESPSFGRQSNFGKTTRQTIADSVLDLIGFTPLLRLNNYLENSSVELIVKLESQNPGGSAKDRPARQMIEHALSRGDIQPGGIVIESSSGNMGIGLAQACNYYGLDFICVVDINAQSQNIDIISALGGTIKLVTRPLNGDFLAARIDTVERLLREHPGAFWTNQYANLDNPGAHREGTIREIVNDLSGEFDALFVATSSTGTARGCRDYLTLIDHQAKIYAVDADGSALFEGVAGPRHISGMGAGKIPPLAEGQMFDHVVRISDARCIAGCRRASRYEALLVGGSGGAVLEAIRREARDLSNKRVIALLHDFGDTVS